MTVTYTGPTDPAHENYRPDLTPFADTAEHTRRVRLADLLADYDGYESDQWSDASERFDDRLPHPIVMVESNQRGSSPPYWVTFWATADEAAQYHVDQEYADDWHAEELVDLDTGDRFAVEVSAHAVKQVPPA